jgi:ribonucleoside-triphosphate reductase
LATIKLLPTEYHNIDFETVTVKTNAGPETRHINRESAIVQLERYKTLQMYYCDQNVSNTISYSVEEVPEIIDWLLENWDYYVGVSFLFRADPTVTAKDLGFEYLPQEPVSKERYDRYVNQLEEIDWENTGIFDEEDADTSDCINNVCPIK